VTKFNGKKAKVEVFAYGNEPSTWTLTMDNNNELNIDDSKTYGQSQVESIAYLLKMYEAGDEEYGSRIRKIFDLEWQECGSNEDVIKLALYYVGYNDENEKEDIAALAQLKQKLSNNIKKLAKSVITDIEDSREFSAVVNIERKAWDKLSYKIDTVSQRLNVYGKLKRKEQVGLGWNNATFFEAVKGTEMETKVRAILADR